ncbi:MAG: hypothetical protein U0Y10_13955 [Spirosomataceae bacterium]
MLKKYFQVNPYIILAIILIVEITFNIVIKAYSLDEKVMYNSLSEYLTLDEIQKTSESVSAKFLPSLLLAIVQVVVEIFLTAMCVNIACLLLRVEVSLKQIWGIVIRAYIIFTFSRILMMGLYFYFGVNKVEDLDYYSKFSVYGLLNLKNVELWQYYILQLFNVFQAIFVMLVALGMNSVQNRSVIKWFFTVLGAYGAYLLITVVLVAFFLAV